MGGDGGAGAVARFENGNSAPAAAAHAGKGNGQRLIPLNGGIDPQGNADAVRGAVFGGQGDAARKGEIHQIARRYIAGDGVFERGIRRERAAGQGDGKQRIFALVVGARVVHAVQRGGNGDGAGIVGGNHNDGGICAPFNMHVWRRVADAGDGEGDGFIPLVQRIGFGKNAEGKAHAFIPQRAIGCRVANPAIIGSPARRAAQIVEHAECIGVPVAFGIDLQAETGRPNQPLFKLAAGANKRSVPAFCHSGEEDQAIAGSDGDARHARRFIRICPGAVGFCAPGELGQAGKSEAQRLSALEDRVIGDAQADGSSARPRGDGDGARRRCPAVIVGVGRIALSANGILHLDRLAVGRAVGRNGDDEERPAKALALQPVSFGHLTQSNEHAIGGNGHRGSGGCVQGGPGCTAAAAVYADEAHPQGLFALCQAVIYNVHGKAYGNGVWEAAGGGDIFF